MTRLWPRSAPCRTWSRPSCCISDPGVARRLAGTAAFLLSVLCGVPVSASSWEVRQLGRLDGLVDLFGGTRTDTVIVETVSGTTGLRFTPEGALQFVSAPPLPVGPPDMIPHGRCAAGKGDIRLACLTAPTGRYDHGVLGDRVEAAALTVRRRDGDWVDHRLAGDAVFEDLTPRLADLDADGRDEVIVVKSAPGSGASLAVLGLDGTALRLKSQSAPIGRSNRWLNPVGAGDFDGDGRLEVAVVRTPHIGGILMIYRSDGARMAVVGRQGGFSNHRMGSTVLGMAAVLDVDGDGLDDIVLPRQDHSRIAAVSYAGGSFREIAAADLDAAVSTSMVTPDVDHNGRPDVVFGLADGRLIALVR